MSIGDTFGSLSGWITRLLSEAGFGGSRGLTVGAGSTGLGWLGCAVGGLSGCVTGVAAGA
jgi:hypothetical protein